MNLHNLDRLIAKMEQIEAGKSLIRFNMEQWLTYQHHNYKMTFDNLLQMVDRHEVAADGETCGTAACMGGLCQLLGAENDHERSQHPYDFAVKWLGLDYNEASNLFHGSWRNRRTYFHLNDITIAMALEQLRKLRADNQESTGHY